MQGQLIPCETIEEFVAAIRPPRPIIIMIKAGDPVDQQMEILKPHLSNGDIMIDAGNANFRDTIRRFDNLKDSGLTFIGMGVSGGEEGARHGPSIMVGGTEDSWKRVEKVLTSISAKYNDDPCVAWLGNDGAGHFVKTIHNGIEYADMQMIAEIYGILRDGLKMSASEIADVFGEWNKGRLNSYLIEITEKVLRAADPITGKPMVDLILDKAGQKGTGKWSVIEAQNMGVAATAIEAAVAARILSSQKDEREAAEKIFGLPTVAAAPADKRPLSPIWKARFWPPRSVLTHRALPSCRPHRRSSTGTCRCRRSPASGAPAASSAQNSSMRSPRPSPRIRMWPTSS